MSEIDSVLPAQLPRKAIFSARKSVNPIIRKVEMIDFPGDKHGEVEVTNGGGRQKIRFLVSGETMVDFRASYLSLLFKTNTYTATLSTDITAIVHSLKIILPSNANVVLEHIECYNQLSACLNLVNSDSSVFSSKWNAGMNILNSTNKSSNLPKARRFLNLNPGGWRKFCFQLNLSAVLNYELYFPIMLAHGLLIEIELASPQECLLYTAADEHWSRVFDKVDGMFMDQTTYDGLDAAVRTHVRTSLTEHFGRPPANRQQPTYTISEAQFNAKCLYFNDEYFNRLVAKASSSEGFNLFFNSSYLYNRLPNEGAVYTHRMLTEQFQNLRRVVLLAVDKRHTVLQNEHSFCTFKNFIESVRFRVGARSFHLIDNKVGHSASSYVETLQSLGRLDKQKPTSITFDTWEKYKNVIIFNFDKTPWKEELHSGQDTTDGKSLRMELRLRSQPEILIRNGNDPADVLPLQEEIDPVNCELIMFSEHTVMMNISNKGVSITR